MARQTDRLHGTTDEVFSIARCADCGLHFLNPRPDREEISRYYSEGYAFHSQPPLMRRAIGLLLNWLANSRLASALAYLPLVEKRLVAYLKPKLADPVREHFASGRSGPLLDIGCGSGVHAHFWGYRGSALAYRDLTEVAGVETAEAARTMLANAGVSVYASLADVPQHMRFGVMRMNWSLEHVHAPSEYFRFMAERLLPGGRAIIAVPNFDGLLYRLEPTCVEVPVHLYHFSQENIRRYAGNHGLATVKALTFSYPQMFVAAAEAGMLNESFKGLTKLSDARAFARALHFVDRAGMGNDLLIILEKPKA